MRRGISAAVVLAAILLASMAARTTATPQPLSGTAQASECSWERHSKRTIKRVKRHGKVRKVVRWKHWWSCEAQAAALTSLGPVSTAPPSPQPEPQPEPEPEANRLAVKSVEFYYVLSRPSVRAGEVTIELNNQGEDAHNLNLRREGDEGEPLQIAETASDQRSVASFDLPAGKYHLWCSLPEHQEKGMEATLAVD